MEKCIIAAVAENRAIGKGGDLPWRLSEDLKFFKRTTMGSPVIMGRTTFESLPRPLAGRKNIVLSRSIKHFENSDESTQVVFVSSVEDALKQAEDNERCFIIGGAKIYEQFIDSADRMYLTLVQTQIADADAFFPDFDSNEWDKELLSDVLADEKSGLKFQFVSYKRKSV